jgi:hypothetical protein
MTESKGKINWRADMSFYIVSSNPRKKEKEKKEKKGAILD